MESEARRSLCFDCPPTIMNINGGNTPDRVHRDSSFLLIQDYCTFTYGGCRCYLRLMFVNHSLIAVFGPSSLNRIRIGPAMRAWPPRTIGLNDRPKDCVASRRECADPALARHLPNGLSLSPTSLSTSAPLHGLLSTHWRTGWDITRLHPRGPCPARCVACHSVFQPAPCLLAVLCSCSGSTSQR